MNQSMNLPTGDCNTCCYWKRLGSKFKGVRVPGGFGKCVRAEGHCNPKKVRLGIGQRGSNFKREQGE